MGYLQGKCERPRGGALAAVLGCCLLTSCTLVDRQGLAPGKPGATSGVGVDDAGGRGSDEGGRGLQSGAPVDAGSQVRDAGPPDTPEAGPDRDAGVEGGLGDAAQEAGLAPTGGLGGGSIPGGGSDLDAGWADAEAGQPSGGETDAGGGMHSDTHSPPVSDLIDAAVATTDERVNLYCECPANQRECTRAGFGDNSCTEAGLNALAVTSEDAVRELLACWLPAEEAYTKCVDRELDCWSVQSSIRGCSRDHQAATDRCNAGSFVAASLKRLCAR